MGNTFYTNQTVTAYVTERTLSPVLDACRPVSNQCPHYEILDLTHDTLAKHRVSMSPFKRDSYAMDVEIIPDPDIKPMYLNLMRVGYITITSLKVTKYSQRYVTTKSARVRIMRKWLFWGEFVICGV